MQHTFRDLIEAMGGKVTSPVHDDGADAIAAPGEIIHEVGGAIMGSNPDRSVVNQYCQSHEVPNLFVTDGACFVSNADKNPTLSIMAVAWRAADYMIARMKQGAFT
jgi:choline dehydrogenase-like flavoprotein